MMIVREINTQNWQRIIEESSIIPIPLLPSEFGNLALTIVSHEADSNSYIGLLNIEATKQLTQEPNARITAIINLLEKRGLNVAVTITLTSESTYTLKLEIIS